MDGSDPHPSASRDGLLPSGEGIWRDVFGMELILPRRAASGEGDHAEHGGEGGCESRRGRASPNFCRDRNASFARRLHRLRRWRRRGETQKQSLMSLMSLTRLSWKRTALRRSPVGCGCQRSSRRHPTAGGVPGAKIGFRAASAPARRAFQAKLHHNDAVTLGAGEGLFAPVRYAVAPVIDRP